MRGIEREDVIGQNSPRFSQGGDCFTMSEIVDAWRDTPVGFVVYFSCLKIF